MVTSTPITCPVGTVAQAGTGLCVPSTIFIKGSSGSGTAGASSSGSGSTGSSLSSSGTGSGTAGAGSSGSGTFTHASSPMNKPSSDPTQDPMAFLQSNCIPQIPIPCWGLIAGGILGAIIVFKLLR